MVSVSKFFASGIALPALLVVSACASGPQRIESAEDAWRAYETRLIERGRLRTERAPSGITYTNADLIETFREIMFFDEAIRGETSYREGRAPRLLDKRDETVNFSIWGNGVTEQDRADLAEIASRIAEATSLQITESAQSPDIEVFILTRQERLSLAVKVRAAGAEAMANDLINDLDGLVCAAYFFASDEFPGLVEHTIIIPNEVTGLLRKSCIEEEFGQAFGPSADYDDARPSIFNDDEEFALFTEHDAWLFRVLYDPRLKDGMDMETAMPIAARILAELRPEG